MDNILPSTLKEDLMMRDNKNFNVDQMNSEPQYIVPKNSLKSPFINSLNDEISPDLHDKIITYLEMILDRLDCRLTTWLHNMERLQGYSVKGIEISIHLDKIAQLLHSQKFSISKQVRLMQNSLERLLNPLWDLNEDIFSIFGDLDALYAELNFFVNRGSGSTSLPDVELIHRINEKVIYLKLMIVE